MKRLFSVIMVCLLCLSMFTILAPKVKADSVTSYPWPMFHHDSMHTGFSSSSAPITNNSLWTFQTGDRIYSSPVVADSKVFVGSMDNKTYAVDQSSGALVWSSQLDESILGSPAVDNGKVFISDFSNLYALDEATGTTIWRQHFSIYELPSGFPTVKDGLVVIGNYGGGAYSGVMAFDEDTGSVVWDTNPPPSPFPSGGLAMMVHSAVAIADSKVFVAPLSPPEVYALDEFTGGVIWSQYTHNSGSIYCSPAIADGKVFVGVEGNPSGALLALDENTGQIIWSQQLSDSIFSSPAVAYGKVFIGCNDRKVYAFDESNGNLAWTYATNDRIETSSPAVADGKVYIGSADGSFYCFDAFTGGKLWSYETGYAWGASSPAVVAGVVYVGSDDGRIYAFGSSSSPQTLTSIFCSPNPVAVSSPVTCTATVSGSNPTGTVAWSTSSNTGRFSSSNCILSSGRCSTTYTDTSPGTVTITASYGGDSNNAASSNSTTLMVMALASHLIFEDEFSKDTYLNTSLWRVNSPMLYSISAYESSAFGEGVSVDNPNLPIGFTSQGMRWGMSGYDSMSGITSNIVFTPPYVVQLNASISMLTGGNPVAIFLSNKETSSFIAIFMSYSIWVQIGNVYPSKIYDNVNVGSTYTFQITVTTSSFDLVVINAGDEVAHNDTQLNAVGDYGYYLTLASFAGQVKGQAGRSSYSVESYAASVEVTSSSTWSLNVEVTKDGSSPLTNAHIVVTNLFRGISYTGDTDASGLALFPDLVSGFYTVVASVSQNGNIITDQSSVLIGDASNPLQQILLTSLLLPIPDPPPLSVGSPKPSRDVEGLPPINETFSVVPSGYVGNYAFAWHINGTAVHGSDTYNQVFYDPGTYVVSVTVTSDGTWYNQPAPHGPQSVTSDSLGIFVNDTPFLASLIPTTSPNYVPISYNGFLHQAVFYLEQGKVLIVANITDNAPVVTIPDWLKLVTGIDNAWHGVTLSDSSGSSDTGLIVQPNHPLALINATLPAGTPADIPSLKGYKFKVCLDPNAFWAVVSDCVTAMFAVAGIMTPITAAVPESLSSEIISELISVAAQSLSSMVIDTKTNTKDIVHAVQSWINKIPQSLVPSVLKLIPDVIQRIAKNLAPGVIQQIIAKIGVNVAALVGELSSAIGAAYPLTIMVIDFAAIVSTILTGVVPEEYSIADLSAMSSYTVKGHSPAPYVTVQKGAETYGYNGNWVSSTSAFVCSDYTPDEYSFAIEGPETVQLLVQAAPGESLTSYDIALYNNGLEKDVTGVVAAGNPIEYTVTYENDSIKVVHDVAVASVVAVVPHCSNNVGNDLWVFQGLPAYVNVTVLNNGDFDESASVTLYYNITTDELIGTQNITIPTGENRTLSFVWDTTSVPYCHNYTITAVATIPLDNNPADNTLACGPISVRIKGDINGDGVVDGSDLIIIAKAFGSYGPNCLYPGCPPSQRWNLDSDINGDDRVDGSDLIVAVRNFGK